jgi:Na+-transporting NADH:ubiquinone oxidoreductase subunit D
VTTTAALSNQPASAIETVRRPLLADNPILVQILGVCSALAVTGRMDTTLVMCGALIFVASLSCLGVSLLRTVTPHRVRLMTHMLIIATLVIVVDQYLKARHFALSKALGPYVGLIITNCIILGRTESFASRNGPLSATLDGAGNAAGYAIALILIALVREPLGLGTLLGVRVLPADYTECQLMATAPGAFLSMGVLAWVVRAIRPDVGQPREH